MSTKQDAPDLDPDKYGIKQVSLVMLYGEKPEQFASLITSCQAIVQNILSSRFQPYALPQIHATLINMETTPEGGRVNRNLWLRDQNSPPVDFQGVLEFLRDGASGRLPMRVRIGGFQEMEIPFTSRTKRPYDRSCVINGGSVVLMGWPTRLPTRSTEPDSARNDAVWTDDLDQLRRDLKQFNILHTYHDSAAAVDNDFYFRIGVIDQRLVHPDEAEQVQVAVRRYLASITPTQIEIPRCAVFVVSYCDITLPPASTSSFSICDEKVSGGFIANLYER